MCISILKPKKKQKKTKNHDIGWPLFSLSKVIYNNIKPNTVTLSHVVI